MERKNNKQTFITLCVILVIGIGYIYQMAPSPVLGQLKDRYGIGNEALLNLAVSIVHPPVSYTHLVNHQHAVLHRRICLYPSDCGRCIQFLEERFPDHDSRSRRSRGTAVCGGLHGH